MNIDVTTLIAIVSPIITLFGGALGMLFWQLQKSHDEQIKLLNSRIYNLEAMIDQALHAAESLATKKLVEDGKSPFQPVAPVLPFQNSPITELQSWQAKIETFHARVVRIYKLFDLEPITVKDEKLE